MATQGETPPTPVSLFDMGLPSPVPLALRQNRQTFDRKTHFSTKHHYESHFGIPQGPCNENVRNLLSSPTPRSTQSTVTTTTVITTTITTNSEVLPGDSQTGYQPWVAISTRTDVQESNTVTSNSDVVSLEYPNAMNIDAPHPRIETLPSVPIALEERKGVRRHFTEIAPEPSKIARCTRKPRRTSTPATIDSSPALPATMSAVISPLSQLANNLQTPTCLLRLSAIPKPSDLIIVRIILPSSDPLGEYLTTVDLKHATTASGEIIISPVLLPPNLLPPTVSLEDCKLRFSWLSADLILHSLTSDTLGLPHSHQEPSSKRPKLS